MFEPFPKIPRLSRAMVVTEKIDGTNASVWITPSDVDAPQHDPEVLATVCLDDGIWVDVRAGSRNRWATRKDDNFGFAKWVQENAEELATGLGEGTHYGEWWGAGIQRRYGLDHKRFSLFNVGRWRSRHVVPLSEEDMAERKMAYAPECCYVVPTLHEGPFSLGKVDEILTWLAAGSCAAPGFDKPEGVMVYHVASRQFFKKTLDGDGHKG